MGKARSYEIIEYRNKIFRAICMSDKLCKLLDCSADENPEDVLPWKRVYPLEFIPDTITETKKYVCFDIAAALDDRNNAYKDLSIYFFISCHQEVIRYKGGLWCDEVVCELDNIFCENNILGVGRTYLLTNLPYTPQDKFKGRVLKFTVKDFNNGLKYGK